MLVAKFGELSRGQGPVQLAHAVIEKKVTVGDVGVVALDRCIGQHHGLWQRLSTWSRARAAP